MATVICPNCGGENNVTNRDGQECAYCGTMLYLPTPKKAKTKDKGHESNNDNRNLSDAKFIVPIASEYSTEKEVRNALNAYLVKQDNVPDDIFDHLEIQTVKWIYLPMWRYNGNISTEWSCDAVVYRKRKVGEEPKYDSKGNLLRIEAVYETYEDYLPKSGHGNTTFDMLIPAIEKIKEELPYQTTNFNTINVDNVKPMKEGMSLVPACALIRKASSDVDSKAVLTDLAIGIKGRAEECSYGNLIPRSTSYLPRFLRKGHECVNEHLNFKYQLNENNTVGELYYIPFVYVAYSYKGATYEWGFMLHPDHAGAYDTPTSEDNTNDEDIDVLKEKSNQIRAKWNIFLFLSGVLSFLVGMIIFLVRNISLYERIGKRYRYQESMFSLLGKYKRRENLIKHGADKKTISEIDAQIQEKYDDEEEEGEDDRTPKSIAEIHEYFAETEVLKQKLLKRMKRFWMWYISLIVIVGGTILGYALYNNWQSEKMQKEEAAAFEIENRRVEQEWHDKFQAEFIGKEMSGTTLYGMPTKRMQIKIIDASHLEYSIAEEDYSNIGLNNLSDSFKTILSKTVPYTIRVTRSSSNDYGGPKEGDISVKIEFDGYVSKNLFGESYHHSNDKFADKFEVAEASKIDDVVSNGYNIVRE